MYTGSMTTMDHDLSYESFEDYLAAQPHLLALIADWDERIKEFRKRFLSSTHKWERNRWRAVVDTTTTNRLELLNALEWDYMNKSESS